MPQLWHTGLTRRPVSEHIYEAIDEDLSIKVSPSGYVMPGEKVGEGMSESEIAAVMAKHRIHRVLVEDGGRFLGLLSTTEILEALCA